MLKKIFRKLKEEGLGTVVKKSFEALLFYIKKYIFSMQKVVTGAKELNSEIISVEPKIKLNLERINEDHIRKLRGRISDAKIDLFFDRRKRNDFFGFVALDEKGEIASFAWIRTSDDVDPNTKLIIKVKEKEAILLDDHTFPEFRGNRIQTFLISERLIFLKERKFTRAFVGYLENNEFSRRSYLKNGFRELTLTTVVNLFCIKIRFKSNLS